MSVKYLLDKKREGKELESSEIEELVNGFVTGEVPDYQMSAFAMAVCCRGMCEREIAALTGVMMRSGRCLEWPGIVTADKHSTGGVGDKLSLIVQPLAATCGIAVPSLTGRGLGITGGTADKLESIPGYNASLGIGEFEKVIAEVGVSMTVQTDEITPADKKLYALRDVTGTVASIPLIVSSILSKKLAEGAGTLVFDVKCGRGAFMKSEEEARELAKRLVAGAKNTGRKSCALLTRMDSPLGLAVGNSNEVAEAITLMTPGAELNRALAMELDLCVELAANMVSLAKEIALDEAKALCRENLAAGKALDLFGKMVAAHGGSLDAFKRKMSRSSFVFKLQSMKSGYVQNIDAELVGRIALSLGAGREKAGDKIDNRAGITLAVSAGDKVAFGSPLAIIEKSSSPDGLEDAAAKLIQAIEIKAAKPETADSLIIEKID